jgi:hypothetical protein
MVLFFHHQQQEPQNNRSIVLAREAKHLATARNWFAADGVFWV